MDRKDIYYPVGRKMNFREEISRFIDAKKGEMTEMLLRFASIPSVKCKEEENRPYGKAVDDVLKLAQNEAEGLGLITKCYERRAILAELSEKESKLAILCHLDVVPAASDVWSTPPFEPVINGNMMFGRGVSDNKAPAVASLYALHAIKSLGIPLRHNVMLYLGGCEENGSADLTYFLEKNTLPQYVFTPDGCFPVGNAERGRIVVTCETDFTSDKIISVCAGKSINAVPDIAEAEILEADINKLREAASRVENVKFDILSCGEAVKITAHGKSTHAAHPAQGVNALTALLSVISEYKAELEQLSSLFPHGVFNGTGLGLNGGLDISLTQLKISEGRMFFTSDGRVDLDVCAKALAETIEKNIPFSVQMRVHEPHFVPSDADIVQRLNKVYEEYSPHKGGTYTLDAMTYAHHVDGAVIFGGVIPGDGAANAHGINECTNLDTMAEAAKIFAGAIIEFCGEGN